MTEKDNKAYMYVVECADGTLYTGYTTDVERRLKTHNAGKGAKYTRARLPVKLLYSEFFDIGKRSIFIERFHCLFITLVTDNKAVFLFA